MRQKKKEQKRKKRLRTLLAGVALLSLVVTTGFMVLPALTMTGEDHVVIEAEEDVDTVQEKANGEEEGTETGIEIKKEESPESAAESTQEENPEDHSESAANNTAENNLSQQEENATDEAEPEKERQTAGALRAPMENANGTGRQVSVEAGNSVTLEGTSAKYHSWFITCDPEGCASIDDTSNQNTVLNAISVGNATVTHKYGSKKNKLNTTEIFTVTLTEKSSVTEEDSKAQPAIGQGMTVSVKDTGRLKKLSDYHVEVKDATDAYTGDTGLLQAYHIYLADQDNQEVAADDLQVNGKSLSLQVTIAYETIPEWFGKAKSIRHYKSSTEKTEQFITGVKFNSDERTIQFTVHGFSDFEIMADENGNPNGDSGGVTKKQGSILSNCTDINPKAANAWQVVDQGYSGNTPEYKTVYGNDSYEAVRVQKNVIPTGTENEFYVYLSVDTKLLMSEYLQYAQFQGTTSDNNHKEQPGDVVNAMTGNMDVVVSRDPKFKNHANFTIKDSSDNVIAENVTLYWSQANNVTFYLKTSSGKYILMGIKVRKDENNTVRLSSEAEQYIYEDVMKLISLDRVTDTMGNYIEYLGAMEGDYSAAPTFDSSTGTLIWTPVMKSNPEEQTTKNGSIITTWSLNVAELVYKVRLKVQKDGFNSCARNMQSKVGDPESCEVNKSAVLVYSTRVGTQTGGGTATFPKPYVRGLLYDYQIKKVDENGNALAGAKFSFYGSGNNSSVAYNLIGTSSGKEGMVSWSHGEDSSSKQGTAANTPGVAWGTYTVKETWAPNGYQMSDDWKNGKRVTLCYTNDSGSLAVNEVNGTHMIYKIQKNGDAPYVTYDTVTNTKIPEAPVKIIKADMIDHRKLLAGAKFSVTKTDAESSSAGSNGTTDGNTQAGTDAGTAEIGADARTAQADTDIGTAQASMNAGAVQADTDTETVQAGTEADTTETDTEVGPWTSGSGDQLGILYVGSLSYGTYTLTETTAPDGYNKISGEVTVEVTAARVTYTQTENGGGQSVTASLADPSKPASADNPYVVYIYDNPGVELPATGGSGRLPYTLGGMMLFASAAFMYSFRKRRGERRTN